MMIRRMTVATGLALLVSSLPAGAGTPIDERWEADADTLVRVGNVKGEIRVEGWDRDEVALTGELGDGSRPLELDTAPGQIRIEVSIPRSANGVEDSVLFLQVPRGASVEAEGVSASIEIEGLDSRQISAEAVSGDVEVEATVENLELKSVSGDVEFEGSAERSRAETVSGDIDMTGIGSELRLTTVSGEVLLSAGALSKGRLETVSGDIELETGLAEGGDLVIESLSGDVDLDLPSEASMRCEVESFSGSIRSDRGEVKKARHGPRQSLAFRVGDGSGRIRIESFSGDVRIRSN